MKDELKHALAFVGMLIAALVCALAGAYILWQFKTTYGLIGGAGFILLSLGIALPIQLGKGAAAVKTNVVLVVPVVYDALTGGGRKTDPPANPPGGAA
jgi:hypothetical protein